MQPIELKTWEDVCATLGIDPVASLTWAEQLPAEDKAAQVAFFKLTKLSKAAYGDKQPNWQDSDEYKYWPYFNMDDDTDASGFGFSGTDCDGWNTFTSVGSRLCYPTREMAKHAGMQFIDWYRDLMVLPKTKMTDATAN